jgi:hypothetical protein
VTKSEMAAMEKKMKGMVDELKTLKSAMDRKGGFSTKKKKVTIAGDESE